MAQLSLSGYVRNLPPYRAFVRPTAKGRSGSSAVGRPPKSERLRRAEKGLPRRRPVGPLALYRTSLRTRVAAV